MNLYRTLSDPEPIREGDEFRMPFSETWTPAYPDMAGKTRRQINAETPGIPCRYAEFRRRRMPVIYVAGPFRAENAWEIEQNIRRAEALALEVWRLNVAVICPHTNTRFFQGAAPDKVWLEGDLEILRRCDAGILVDGWRGSSGTRDELQAANLLKIPFFETLAELKMWLTIRELPRQ